MIKFLTRSSLVLFLGLLQATGADAWIHGGGNPPPDQTRYLVAATRLTAPTNASIPLDTQLSRLSNLSFFTPDYMVCNLRAAYANWWLNDLGLTPQENSVGNNLTLTGASYVVGGVFTPLTFSSVSTTTISDGSSVLSDASFSECLAPRTQVFIRTIDTVTSGQQRPGGMIKQSQNGEGIENTATPQSSKLTSGTVGSSGTAGGTNNGTPYGPVTIFAQGWDGRPVGLILGDSMVAPAIDNGSWAPNSGVQGWAGRGFDSTANGTVRYAAVNLGLTGSRPSQMSTDGTWAFRKTLFALVSALNAGGLPPFTFIFSEGINNDTGSTCGNTTVGLENCMQTYFNYYTGIYPSVKFVQSAAMPNTQNTDFTYWTNLVGQTLNANNCTACMRWQASNWILTKPAPLYATIDQTSHFVDVTATDHWNAQGLLTGTVSSSYTAGSSTIQLSAKPSVGMGLVFEPGAGVGITDGPSLISAISGASPPYTATLFVPLTHSHSSNVSVSESSTIDGAHATVFIHTNAASVIVAGKQIGSFGP